MGLPAGQRVVLETKPLLLLVRDKELVELLPAELHLVLAVLDQRLLVSDGIVLEDGGGGHVSFIRTSKIKMPLSM